jgi:hypothetical protein
VRAAGWPVDADHRERGELAVDVRREARVRVDERRAPELARPLLESDGVVDLMGDVARHLEVELVHRTRIVELAERDEANVVGDRKRLDAPGIDGRCARSANDAESEPCPKRAGAGLVERAGVCCRDPELDEMALGRRRERRADSLPAPGGLDGDREAAVIGLASLPFATRRRPAYEPAVVLERKQRELRAVRDALERMAHARLVDDQVGPRALAHRCRARNVVDCPGPEHGGETLGNDAHDHQSFPVFDFGRASALVGA